MSSLFFFRLSYPFSLRFLFPSPLDYRSPSFIFSVISVISFLIFLFVLSCLQTQIFCEHCSLCSQCPHLTPFRISFSHQPLMPHILLTRGSKSSTIFFKIYFLRHNACNECVECLRITLRSRLQRIIHISDLVSLIIEVVSSQRNGCI